MLQGQVQRWAREPSEACQLPSYAARERQKRLVKRKFTPLVAPPGGVLTLAVPTLVAPPWDLYQVALLWSGSPHVTEKPSCLDVDLARVTGAEDVRALHVGQNDGVRRIQFQGRVRVRCGK